MNNNGYQPNNNNGQQTNYQQQGQQQNFQQGYQQPNYQQGYQQPGFQQGPAPQSRNLAMCIILSVVTCGIYGLYWLYTLNEDMGYISGRKEMSGGMVILLSIITCGIYSFIWNYQQGQKVDELKTKNGLPSSSTGILYLVLSLLGLAIVNYALMQNEINAVAEGRYHL